MADNVRPLILPAASRWPCLIHPDQPAAGVLFVGAAPVRIAPACPACLASAARIHADVAPRSLPADSPPAAPPLPTTQIRVRIPSTRP